ncbi:MAG: hypothetical protein K6E32_07235 [Lachnospiraceae bacterium]|nr:hypothetical protein [Lachnospiraceae bacterium]
MAHQTVAITSTEGKELLRSMVKESDANEVLTRLTYAKDSTGRLLTIGYAPLNTPDNYLALKRGINPQRAYICESATEALSLLSLQQNEGDSTPAYYIVIDRLENKEVIEAVLNQFGREETFLTVNNEESGETCRRENPAIRQMIPILEKWSEDLENGKSLALIPPAADFISNF